MLAADRRGYYLVHESGRRRLGLSSDAIANQHVHLLRDLYGQRAQEVNEDFCRKTCTIGAYILFPGEQVNRKPTINQHRGMHPRIRDRFDLTLDCIRSHYLGQDSPLGETLARYADFFALFESFSGYVEHFLLQDLVDEDGHVRFFIPFEGFLPNPLPTELGDFDTYLDRQLEFVAARNARITRYVHAHQ